MNEITKGAAHTERDKLSILLAVTLACATLFRFVELPTQTWGVAKLLGSPLGFTFDGQFLLVALVVGLVTTGTLSLLQDHPLSDQRDRPLIFSLITPAIGALLVAQLMVQAVSWPMWLVSLTFGGIVIGMLVHLSYRALSPEDTGYARSRTILNVVDYLVGFLLFSILLRIQGRALVIGPAVIILSGLLALDLLSSSGVDTRRVMLFAIIIAVLEGELVWVLGYWPISSWTAATVLTLGLYVWSGVAYQHLLGQLTRQVIIEFIIIAVLMFGLVLWIRP